MKLLTFKFKYLAIAFQIVFMLFILLDLYNFNLARYKQPGPAEYAATSITFFYGSAFLVLSLIFWVVVILSQNFLRTKRVLFNMLMVCIFVFILILALTNFFKHGVDWVSNETRSNFAVFFWAVSLAICIIFYKYLAQKKHVNSQNIS